MPDEKIYSLPGPAGLRAHFFPCQRITLTELAQVLGMSRGRLYKRIEIGKLGLQIRRDEVDRPTVLLEDVITYLHGPTEQSALLEKDQKIASATITVPKKRGRPRKDP